ncbi:MAG: class I SAM-dependent methyltransferase [Deltaproteobacteria bacterium]
MESVICNICNSSDTRLLVVKNSYRVVQCRICRLIYVNPRPTEEELKEVYSEEGQLGKQHHIKEARFNQILDNLAQFKPRGGKKLLDVGCSRGIFMRLAQGRGWEASGIDVDRETIEYVSQTYGLEVSVATITQSPFAAKSFDVVSMLDSIEHMPDPLASVESVRKILRDDGILLLRTPNADGLLPRLTYLLFAKTLGFWEHPGPPKHVYQFSTDTMKKLLHKAGFEIEFIATDEIYVRSTVEELEEEMISALKRVLRGLRGEIVKPSAAGSKPKQEKKPPSSMMKASLPKRAFRLFFRSLSSALVYPAYFAARMLDMGDSMVVIAKKRMADISDSGV